MISVPNWDTYFSFIYCFSVLHILKYNQQAKEFIANKRILAFILKETVEEFEGDSIEYIMQHIEGEPYVGDVAVDSGYTGASFAKIRGENTECSIAGEGTVFSNQMSVSEKREYLKTYGFNPEELGKEMDDMCNLSQGFIEYGMEKGLVQGIEQGTIQTLYRIWVMEMKKFFSIL